VSSCPTAHHQVPLRRAPAVEHCQSPGAVTPSIAGLSSGKRPRPLRGSAGLPVMNAVASVESFDLRIDRAPSPDRETHVPGVDFSPATAVFNQHRFLGSVKPVPPGIENTLSRA
jgi:hypothetical protein